MILRHFSKKLLSVLILLICFIAFYFLKIRPGLIDALSKSFIQTDWFLGADTATTITDSNLVGWQKFYSSSGINIGTSGEIKLDIQITTP